MTVSDTLKSALHQQDTDEVILVLITLDHADLTTPFRATSDAVQTVSNSNTFTPFPFDVTLPVDDPEEPPRARITIDNVDRQIVQAVRDIASPPDITMEIVRGDDPNTIEASYPNFTLADTTYNSLTVTGVLTLENFLQEPYPAASFTPARFPGGF